MNVFIFNVSPVIVGSFIPVIKWNMATAIIDQKITFEMGLRGYHEYGDYWRPYVHQPITFRKEQDNVHDNFAVAGYAKLPGRLIPSIVGHVPLELSRHIWYALEYGAIMNAEVKSERH